MPPEHLPRGPARRRWQQLGRERHQIVLVAAGAVQHQERGRSRRRGRLIVMGE
jgi:hypothetical protein